MGVIQGFVPLGNTKLVHEVRDSFPEAGRSIGTENNPIRIFEVKLPQVEFQQIGSK
jgi:hypothetical protein